MGCDIHYYIEVKKDGQWQHFDWRESFRNGNYEDGSPKYDYEKMFDSPFYVGRNYDLFAILANVRNGRGFAGVPTGAGFNSISNPRGLPNDVTPQIKVESDDWGSDGHSHSWFTVKELKEYDWNQETVHFGIVSLEGYKHFKEHGKPNSWCGGVDGRLVVKITNKQMDDILDGGPHDPNKSYYTSVSWKEKYGESVKWFLETTLPAIEQLGDQNDVRIVFWFDN